MLTKNEWIDRKTDELIPNPWSACYPWQGYKNGKWKWANLKSILNIYMNMQYLILHNWIYLEDQLIVTLLLFYKLFQSAVTVEFRLFSFISELHLCKIYQAEKRNRATDSRTLYIFLQNRILYNIFEYRLWKTKGNMKNLNYVIDWFQIVVIAMFTELIKYFCSI